MNSWEWIFRQSKVNDGVYDGDRLAVQNWDWPRGTWLQERLRQLRNASGRHSKELSEQTARQIH
jgi:hypothetical protein